MPPGHLFIHIGPPKTATTSLQYAFQNFSFPRFKYLGVHQPRGVKESSVSSVLLSHINGVKSAEISKAVEEIKALTLVGTICVISEEMFLVEKIGNEIFKKLTTLDVALAEIPRTYLITVRRPIDALPSYYQEMFSRLPSAMRKNEQLFFQSARCDCYDYPKIFTWFASRGVQVKFIDFDILKAGEVEAQYLFGPESGLAGVFRLPKENIGRRASGLERVLIHPSWIEAIAISISVSTAPTAKTFHRILRKIISLRTGIEECRSIEIAPAHLQKYEKAFEWAKNSKYI
jgi:hypothetical protein